MPAILSWPLAERLGGKEIPDVVLPTQGEVHFGAAEHEQRCGDCVKDADEGRG